MDSLRGLVDNVKIGKERIMSRHFSDYNNIEPSSILSPQKFIDSKEYWDKVCKEFDIALRQECYEHPSAFRTAILEATIKNRGVKIAGLN